MGDDRPLPEGWIKELDANYQQFYYVDTKATPPRSIWVHPYEDEQYLREHPEYARPNERQSASYQGDSSSSHAAGATGDMAGRGTDKKRSFFGKLKDKAIGTKEEREAARVEEQRMMEERRRRHYEQQAYYSQYPQQGYQQTYAPQATHQRRTGMGSMALPLVGGLAGGLLLGQALDGGFGGGDFGGGDFGGGDFGGGDFGGGDFGGGDF